MRLQNQRIPWAWANLLLNYYGGNRDWGENKNWYAIRRRQPAGAFRFYVWDGEQVLQGVREDIVNRPYEIPFRLSEEARDSPEFRLTLRDPDPPRERTTPPVPRPRERRVERIGRVPSGQQPVNGISPTRIPRPPSPQRGARRQP